MPAYMFSRATPLLAGALGLAPMAAAQYRNPYTGATFNNSYSRMLDMTRTWNQNLWNAQKAIPTLSGSTSTPATQMPAAPMTGQYPLEATDFLSMPFRILPDRLVAGNALLQQKQYMHMLYTQFLMEFDGQYRRSNIAVAVAYAISVSLRVDRGRQLSVPEWNQLVFRLNDTLAMTPQSTP